MRRAATIFGKIILAVAGDSNKTPLFSLAERVEIATEVFAHDDRVIVEGFEGLLVNYVKSRQAAVILRGMRAVSDFEFEFQMALMNRKLDRSIETVFIMPPAICALWPSRPVPDAVPITPGRKAPNISSQG